MIRPSGRSVRPRLGEAVVRRLYRRAVVTTQITVPAVPSMIDEYLKMCDNVFAVAGVQYTAEQSAQLKTVLEAELAKAYTASSRSNIVISFHAPFGISMNYRVTTESVTLGGAYDGWVSTRGRDRCSAPSRTPGCGRCPAKSRTPRLIPFSTSVREPAAMRWLWRGVATRWMRWR